MKKISAIIATYNRAHFLDGLFESILSQTIDKTEYEIILINNNSNDETESKCMQFIESNPDTFVTYYQEKNQGLSFARNRGIKESNSKYVTFLDDDAVLTPNFFEETINFMESNEKASAIGGKILLKFLCKKPNWYNPYLASLLGYFNCGDRTKIFTKNYFRGSNMSFRSDLFQKHEAFNTKLGRVGKQLYGNEEKELFYRLRENGEEIWYVPSAIVLHLVPIERTKYKFIKKQAIGTGISQYQHASVQGKTNICITLIKEFFKWLATFGLAFFYLFKFKFAVSIMLIRFRFWVSYGMLYQKSATKLLQ